jgi:hypothetical protein
MPCAPILSLLAAALLAGQVSIPQLVVAFGATDKNGQAITDLKPDEVSVIENGQKRTLDRMELDNRPLTVALVLDSSVMMGNAFQADVVPAAIGFLKRLPPESRFSVWITSDRPKQLVPEGTDVKAAEDALRGSAAFGSNAAIDTLIAASQELAKIDRTRRSAVVAVTSASMGAVTIDVHAELPKASLRPTYAIVEVILMDQDAALEDSIKALTARTGGFHERVFAAMAVDGQLRRVAEQLGARYRLAYKPEADPRTASIEVKASRKNVRIAMSSSFSTQW